MRSDTAAEKLIPLFYEHVVLTTCEKCAIPVWEGDSVPDPEAQFLLEVYGCVARATWANLHKFINVAMDKEVQTTDVTEAINVAKKLVAALLREEPNDNGDDALRLADRGVLKYWPAKKKRSVSNNEETQMETQTTTTGTKKGFGGMKGKPTPVKKTEKKAAPEKTEKKVAEKKVTAPKKAAAPKKAESGEKRTRRGKFQPSDKIVVLSKDNPKKAGTGAHARFELYKKHNTVEKYLAAGGLPADLNWDTKQKFIKVG